MKLIVCMLLALSLASCWYADMQRGLAKTVYPEQYSQQKGAALLTQAGQRQYILEEKRQLQELQRRPGNSEQLQRLLSERQQKLDKMLEMLSQLERLEHRQ